MFSLFQVDPDWARAGLLMGPAVALFILAVLNEPDRRGFGASLLSFLWMLFVLPFVNLLALELGWWRFHADDNIFLGMPFDVLLGWAIFWGPLLFLVFRKLNLWVLTALVVLIDVLAMPNLGPLVVLGDNWLLGEAAVVLSCFLPAQILARFTAAKTFLAIRSTMQAIGHGTLVFLFLPAVVYQAVGQPFPQSLSLPLWQGAVAVVLIIFSLVFGWVAAQEFCVRGNGTPIPFDPPEKLVTSGPYAYLANPMQVSTILLTLLLSFVLRQPLLLIGALYGWLFSVTVVPWHNKDHIAVRFFDSWPAYRGEVRNWFPRWRPYDKNKAKLEVPPDSKFGAWLSSKTLAGLDIKTKISAGGLAYASGGYRCAGLEAVSRSLDHINFGWAFIGWMVRLPLFFRAGTLLRR